MRELRWYERLWYNGAVRDTAKRAINTFFQTLSAAILVTGSIGFIGFASIAWGPALSVAGLAALFSLIQSIIRHTDTKGINYP